MLAFNRDRVVTMNIVKFFKQIDWLCKNNLEGLTHPGALSDTNQTV